MKKTNEFITYGFFINPTQFRQITPNNKKYWRNKPDGGVWASPVNSRAGWREWCIRENWNVESLSVYTKWKLADQSKILIIDSERDVKEAYKKYNLEFKGLYLESERAYLDFWKMKNDGWDGVWLTENGLMEAGKYYGIMTHDGKYLDLYGWDVESIVVWNVDQIVITEKGRL